MSQKKVEALLQSRAKSKIQFEQLARHSEELAKRDPAKYQRVLRRTVSEGYLYLVALFLMTIAFIGVSVLLAVYAHMSYWAFKLAIGAGLFAIALIRALYVKLEGPTGMELSRASSPKLWAMIEEISQQVGAPMPDSILLIGECTAHVVQIRSFGFWGKSSSTLSIGFPLLLGLSTEELRAVIVHELAHLAKGHGLTGAKVWRVLQTWYRVQQGAAKSVLNQIAVGLFTLWYLPRLRAVQLSLSRQHEFEADRFGVEAVGVDTYASMLLKLSFLDDHFERTFSNGLRKLALKSESNPSEIYQQVPSWMSVAASADVVQVLIDSDLSRESDFMDSHPSLKRRLEAIGFPVEDVRQKIEQLCQPPSESALAGFFSGTVPQLLTRFTAYTDQRTRHAWTLCQSWLQYLRNLRAELLEIPFEQRSPGDLAELLDLDSRLAGKSLELDQVWDLHRAAPDDVRVKRVLGLQLARKFDVSAIELLESVRESVPQDRDVEAELVRLYQLHGYQEILEKRQAEQDRISAIQTIAYREANDLTGKMNLQPSSWDPEFRSAVASQLASLKKVGALYQATRVLETNDVEISFVVFRPKVGFLYTEQNKAELKLKVAQLCQPNRGTVVHLADTWTDHALKQIKRVEGSQIFPPAQA